jgi:DNA-binding transcriptional LysR family regulator
MARRSATDLNLLAVFEALTRTRSVTRAALLLGLSKAATSRALGRLRAGLGDPILVRAGAGWGLSDRALALADRVKALADESRAVLAPPPPFEPATSTREFRVHATDHVVSLVGATLCTAVSRQAPEVGVRFLPILPDDVAALRDGGVDLAIGVFPELPAEFRTQALFEDRFAVVARRGHPRVRGRLSLSDFVALAHVQIAPRGRPGGVLDDALRRRGLARKVTRSLPYYLAALELVAGGDCVLTMSERLARRHADHFGLQVVRPPLELAPYKIVQVWHPRVDADAAHLWFRRLVARVARLR